MRTNSPPPPTSGPIRLTQRPVVLTPREHHCLMGALADYATLTRGSLLAEVAREIGEKLKPEEAT